jgi:4'-phosphopantetheinyl transferase
LELHRHEIDVWHVYLDAFHDADAALAMLDAREIERYNRFASEDAARQFLAGRALTRAALSRYTGVPAGNWRFAANSHGRLSVDEPYRHRDLVFNLSHCSGLAVLAVARSAEIGIDAEAVDRSVDIEGVGRSVFTQPEADWVLRSRGLERDRFFDLWTLKEAYIKARGRGFSLPPDSFAIVGVDGRFRLQCDRDCDPRPERWQFRLSNPRPHLRVALAIGSRSSTRIRALTCGGLGKNLWVRLDHNQSYDVP